MPHTMKQVLKVTGILKDNRKNKDRIPYRIGGLIFRSEDDYKLLKYIDDNVRVLEKCMEEGLTNYAYYFCSIQPIKIIQTNSGWREELIGLFPNVSDLAYYDKDDNLEDINEYKIGTSFFYLFRVKDKKGRFMWFP